MGIDVTEKGFFRKADSGADGGGSGQKDEENGAAKDKEAMNNKEQEPPFDVLGVLRKNLKKIDGFIEDYDPISASDLLKTSNDLIKTYKPSSEQEKNALLFFIDRLKQKAEGLNYQWEEDLPNTASELEGEQNSAETLETDDDDEPDKRPWQKEFDRLWDILQDTYRKTASSSGEIIDLTSQLTEIVEKNFSSEQKQAYRRALLMRDVANPTAVFRHLCAENYEEVRDNAYLNEVSELRRFMELKDVFGVSITEIIEYLETDAFENIRHEVIKDDGSRVFFHWNYAANGDPEEDMSVKKNPDGSINFSGWGEDWTQNKALTLQDLLENKFPKLKEVPKFVSDSLITFVIISELRYHKFYPYYNYYQNSPINGMNAGAILPWGIPGYLGYKAASIGKIPGYQSILMLTRHPSDENAFKKPKGKSLFKGVNVSFNKDWARGRFRKQKEYVDSREESFVGDLMSKENSKRNRYAEALENRKTMMEVRNVLCWMFSPDTEFGYVELHPDMQLLPSPWDVIKGEWRGQKISITLDDLFEVYNQFDSFAKDIDQNPKINHPGQAMSYLSDLISNTSKYKVIFSKLGIDREPPNPAFQELRELVQLMYMLFIKKLFDQYIDLPRLKGLSYALTPKHMLFAQDVIQEVKSDKTLPGFIRDYIVQNMKEIDVSPQKASGKTAWGTVFYPPIKKDTTPFLLKIEQFFGSKTARTLNQWLKPAKPEEKNPNEQ